jgi:Domain of unknown function (DUF4365)
MEENHKKIIPTSPAAYSNTSAVELQSISTFLRLLDSKYIKDDIKKLDKYPNTDGTVEITDEEQIPIGKVEVQIKTLSASDLERPKHQFTAEFLSYCEDSILPVVLIAVDNTNNKAYWKHINMEAIEEAAQKMTGQSCSMIIPIENCIDGKDTQYVADWTVIVKTTRKKLWNYDFLMIKNEDLENKLNQLKAQLQQPSAETSIFYKEIHTFLDHYNHILDREFKAVKEVLFFNYWKIGIGIIEYSFSEISFFLYPIEYTKNELLIKVIKPGTRLDLITAMTNREILVLVRNNRNNEIRENPFEYAYRLLRDDILRVIGEHNFIIDDIFLAHEYLISFIDRFYYLFGVEKDLKEYSLHNLKRVIYRILPIIIESDTSFAKGTTVANQDVEKYSSPSFIPTFSKKIADAEKKISEDYKPEIRVVVKSSTYDINLIIYFINYLEANSLTTACRQYEIKAPPAKIDPYKPATWDRQFIFNKLKVFFSNFLRIYQILIESKFPYLIKQLNIFNNCSLIVYILRFKDPQGNPLTKPYLEFYKLKSNRIFDPKIIFFDEEEVGCFIDRKKYLLEQNYTCEVDNARCTIVGMGGQPLDFLFDKLPTYYLVNEMLLKNVEDFFRSQEQLRS